MVQWERKAYKRLEAQKIQNMMNNAVEVDVSDNDGDDGVGNGDDDGDA